VRGAERAATRDLLRRWRIGAALAASLLAAVAVWNVQRAQKAPPASAAVAHTQTSPGSDRIFADLNDGASRKGDEIFRGEFRSDEIFTWKEQGG